MFTGLVPAVYQNAMEYYAFLKQQQLKKITLENSYEYILFWIDWLSIWLGKVNQEANITLSRSQYFQVLYVISLKYKSWKTQRFCNFLFKLAIPDIVTLLKLIKCTYKL